MIAYKATYNYECISKTYEIGQEYKLDKKPILCKYGFHYCKNAKDTLNYYPLKSDFKLLEIEDLNPNDTITDYDKSCSNHIKIIREITDPEELFSLLGKQYTYNENGKILTSKNSDGYSYECTYDESGNELTYKSSDGYSYECTYDESGNELTYKDSNGYSYECTYDENGNKLTYKDSNGFSCEYTYDEFGYELTYKNSNGFSR